MRFAVLGGRGFIGQELVLRLSRSSASVVTVVAPRLRSSATTVDGVLADARAEQREFAALTERLRGIDVVVNAAGMATPDGAGRDRLTGANAVLPTLAAMAAREAGVRRFVHLSSAAVQGARPVLDESDELAPFSAYSRSKALAECALARLREDADPAHGGSIELVSVRATSVQGPGRPTTQQLARIARSPLASVAGGERRPTPVTSVRHLVTFVLTVATWPEPVPPVVLQPSEGLSADEVLAVAGGRHPVRIPAGLARAVIGAGRMAAGVVGDRLAGPVRRVELMWFGQGEDPAWARENGVSVQGDLRQVLERAGRR